MKEGILATIANTPLIKLKRLFSNTCIDVFAKLEGFNPGGSIKDRAALSIIQHAIQSGEIQPGTTIIESTSGNMGIGLAQVCAYFGLPFICVVDIKTTRQNIEILRAYGAKIDIVMEPDPTTGEYLTARIERVKYLLRTIPGSIWTNQYANSANAAAHHATMREIVEQLGAPPNYIFCATSTCGTLRGCAEYIQYHKLPTKIYAVDAVGSVIFADLPQKRLIPGHGAAQRPALFTSGLADHHGLVTDLECIVGCRRLLHYETILAGGSSGAIVTALDKVKDTLPDGSLCVLILCDRGERYLDTIYSDIWVEEQFGEIQYSWKVGSSHPSGICP